MKPFHFRPQPALDVRRTQDEAAQRALAVAHAALLRAEQAVDAALAAVETGCARGAEALVAVRSAHELEWHRNWMTGLERGVARARQQREERRVEVKTATLRAQEARRRLRALERLRERAFEQYEAVARREEQKALDLLGSLQHAVKQIRREEKGRW
jgi:flagellar export protein FliJ